MFYSPLVPVCIRLTFVFKVAGRLKLQEIAEGGTSSRKLCLNSTVLWSRSEDGANTGGVCPRSFRFHLQLPPMITVDGESYVCSFFFLFTR
jgi:hypothetical protein